MPYPTLRYDPPFVFGANFHAQDVRHHQRPTHFRFMAANTANALHIIQVLEEATTARCTTLSQRIGEHLSAEEAYPLGTRATIQAIVYDSSDAIYKVSLRNWRPEMNTTGFSALFLGEAATLPDGTLAELSHPPQNPNSGYPFSRIGRVGVVNKPYSQ